MRLDFEVIPIKERSAMLLLRYGRLDVDDGILVLVNTQMHESDSFWWDNLFAVGAGNHSHTCNCGSCADCGTLPLWAGKGRGRLYSAGQPDGARADRMLYQAT